MINNKLENKNEKVDNETINKQNIQRPKKEVIRSYEYLTNQFIKTLDEFNGYGFDRRKTFYDFLQLTICAFSQFQYESEYREVMLTYKHKAEACTKLFAKLLAIVMEYYDMANQNNDLKDIFGDVYEEYINSTYHAEKTGQFFTPTTICTLMAKMVNPIPPELHSQLSMFQKPVTICDPCAGSGRLPMAAWIEARHISGLPNPNIEFTLMDIDNICAKMSILNMYLMGAYNTTVFHQNALYPVDEYRWGGYVIMKHPYSGLPCITRFDKDGKLIHNFEVMGNLIKEKYKDEIAVISTIREVFNKAKVHEIEHKLEKSKEHLRGYDKSLPLFSYMEEIYKEEII